MTAIGIRSAAVLRVSAEDTTPETSRPPASPLITAEGPTAVGTLLARPGAPRQAWASARGGLHDQGRFTVALLSAARTSAGTNFGSSSFSGSRFGSLHVWVLRERAIRIEHAPIWWFTLQFLWRPSRFWQQLGLAWKRLARRPISRVRLAWLRLEQRFLAWLPIQLRLLRELFWSGLGLGMGLWHGMAVLG